MATDPESDFDAVAAAKELDELLAGDVASGAKNGDYIATLEAEIQDLNAILAKRNAELAKANERADQAHAEIEAAGRRLAGAAEKELQQRTRKLLESLLPVVDDLDRGIAAARKHAESADVGLGLELVKRSLLAQLGLFGVTHTPAIGEMFDPRRHDAIALVPVRDASQDGRVIDVMREGYAIGDDILRPAGVAVGKLAK